MRNKSSLVLIFFLTATFISCGDNSPFDEDYWDNSDGRQEEVSSEGGQYVAVLRAFPNMPVDARGSMVIDLNRLASDLTVNLNEVPTSIVSARHEYSATTCENLPLPEIPTLTEETQSFSYTESGSRNSLLADINSSLGTNTDVLALDGLTVVVNATIRNDQFPQGTTFPISCGQLFLVFEEQVPTTGGTVAGTTGAVTGNVAGGTTLGTATGNVAGGTTLGTATGNAAGGTTGITTGGATGSNVGSVSGVVSGAVGGATIGVVSGSGTGTVSGVAGGVTAGVVGGTVPGNTGFSGGTTAIPSPVPGSTGLSGGTTGF